MTKFGEFELNEVFSDFGDAQESSGLVINERPAEQIYSVQRRPEAFALIKNGKISESDENFKAVFGNSEGLKLSELFADSVSAKTKAPALEENGFVEVRMKDIRNNIFWAALRLSGDELTVEDIDIKKNFEIDCEDLLEEQERRFDSFSRCESTVIH